MGRKTTRVAINLPAGYSDRITRAAAASGLNRRDWLLGLILDGLRARRVRITSLGKSVPVMTGRIRYPDRVEIWILRDTKEQCEAAAARERIPVSYWFRCLVQRGLDGTLGVK